METAGAGITIYTCQQVYLLTLSVVTYFPEFWNSSLN